MERSAGRSYLASVGLGIVAAALLVPSAEPAGLGAETASYGLSGDKIM